MDLYILDGHTPVPVNDVSEWARWMETHERNVAQARWGDARGVNIAHVSTVFLGVDHGWGGPPVLFETMVFAPGSPNDERQLRYRTWEEAEAGHAVLVSIMRHELGQADHAPQDETEQERADDDHHE